MVSQRGARPVCSQRVREQTSAAMVGCCDSSELEGPNGGARRTVLLCIPVCGEREPPVRKSGRVPQCIQRQVVELANKRLDVVTSERRC